MALDEARAVLYEIARLNPRVVITMEGGLRLSMADITEVLAAFNVCERDRDEARKGWEVSSANAERFSKEAAKWQRQAERALGERDEARRMLKERDEPRT